MKLENINWETGDCEVKFKKGEYESFKKKAMEFCNVKTFTDAVGNKYLNFVVVNKAKEILRGEDV